MCGYQEGSSALLCVLPLPVHSKMATAMMTRSLAVASTSQPRCPPACACCQAWLLWACLMAFIYAVLLLKLLRCMLQAVLLSTLAEAPDCLCLALQRTAVPRDAPRPAAALVDAAAPGHARGADRRLPAWHVWQRRIWCANRDPGSSCQAAWLKLVLDSTSLLSLQKTPGRGTGSFCANNNPLAHWLSARVVRLRALCVELECGRPGRPSVGAGWLALWNVLTAPAVHAFLQATNTQKGDATPCCVVAPTLLCSRSEQHRGARLCRHCCLHPVVCRVCMRSLSQVSPCTDSAGCSTALGGVLMSLSKQQVWSAVPSSSVYISLMCPQAKLVCC